MHMSRLLYINIIIVLLDKIRKILSFRFGSSDMVPRLGIEPRTQGFSVPCSTY